MSDSDATVLENYKLARDQLIADIDGAPATVTIRDHSVTFTNNDLEKLERLIAVYERKVNAGLGRTSRTYARVKR